MPRAKTCRETISAGPLPHIYPSRRSSCEGGLKSPLLRGERHFKRQVGRGYLRVEACRNTVGSHFLAARHFKLLYSPFANSYLR